MKTIQCAHPPHPHPEPALQSVSESGNMFVNFVSAKSRVVPLNKVLSFLARTVGDLYFLSDKI